MACKYVYTAPESPLPKLFKSRLSLCGLQKLHAAGPPDLWIRGTESSASSGVNETPKLTQY